MPPQVVDRANADIDNGEIWRARNRLEGYVGSRGYQIDVVEMLGEVCFQMGDLPAAGRFWFFTALNTPEKREAVETLVRCQGGIPSQLYSQLPRRLRATRPGRLIPEVRLRLETLEAGLTQRRRRRRSPRQAPRDGAADTFAFAILGAVVLFFLYCFGLGVRQLMGAL